MISLRINGAERTVDVDPDTPLLWVLREQLRLTGTKYSCGIGRCGACAVHVDGRTKFSCLTTAQEVSGRDVTTIEALSASAVGQALQRAWIAEGVPQCGYCQSGQLMVAATLLRETPGRPTQEQIVAAMSRVLCRCGTYLAIVRAIGRASEELSR